MPLHKGDKAAGFMGLILGAVFVFVTMLAIVMMTNAKFAGHEAGTPAAAHQSGH